MDNLVYIFFSALLINNFTLSYFLGLCPFFGVTGKLVTAFRLGLANIFVMLITSICAWFLNTYILVYAPYLKTITYIVVIASTVQFVEMVIKKLSPALVSGSGNLPAPHHHQLRHFGPGAFFHKPRLRSGGGAGLRPGRRRRFDPGAGLDGGTTRRGGAFQHPFGHQGHGDELAHCRNPLPGLHGICRFIQLLIIQFPGLSPA